MGINWKFYPNIPASTHNPSADQPLMLVNNASTDGIISVDHVGFNTNGPVPGPQGGGGQHLQVTFNGNNVPTSTPTVTNFSVLYTNAANQNLSANAFLVNSQATYLLSCIRAFASFNRTGTPTFINQYNCASVSGGPGIFTVTLNSNVCTGNNIVPIIYVSGSPNLVSWSFANPVLTINVSASGVNTVNFVILQN